MMKKSISVVIPNYNGRVLLEKNLPFLYQALKASKCEFEVIISDDHSSDDSIHFIKKNYPSIFILENEINVGFAGNINKGIRKASKELVFLVNSDIELAEDYFIPLFKYFDQEKTFGVMGRIIAMDSDSVQDGAKYPAYRWGSLRPTINYLPEEGRASMLPSLFLSGANALVDRKKLLELGGFEELFNPFYWEDVELGIKAWRMGYFCYYEDQSICRHPISATIDKYHKKKKVSRISGRNKILFHFLHLDGLPLFNWFTLYGGKTLLRIFFLKLDYLQSLILFFKTIPTGFPCKKIIAPTTKPPESF